MQQLTSHQCRLCPSEDTELVRIGYLPFSEKRIEFWGCVDHSLIIASATLVTTYDASRHMETCTIKITKQNNEALEQ